MPLVQPEHEPQHSAVSSALLLWNVAMVLLVAPALGFVAVGFRGVTLLAAATVAAGVIFGGLYLKYSDIVLAWLENRIHLQNKLRDLELRANLLETQIRSAESAEEESA